MLNNIRPIPEKVSEVISESKMDHDTIEKILVVVVLYNARLVDSPTFQSLRNSVHALYSNIRVDLMICDNSLFPQVDINNIDYDNFNFYYLHDSTNAGISLSYNRAVELASVKQKQWILVLDQDTVLPIDAINKYIHSLKKWPGYSVYAPKVYSNKLLLSPCRYFAYRGSPFENIEAGVHRLKRKNVINSGLLIDISAYRRVGGYDEKVWLYYSDFIFFNRLKKIFNEFVVVDLVLEHELSSSDYTEISFALNRFIYYCQGAKAASVSSGNIAAYVGHGITVALRSILMCKRFKNVIFLKVFYKNYILSSNEKYISN